MASSPGSHWIAASESASAAPAPHRVSTRHQRSRFSPADMAAKATTSSASSSMASGAPARITVAKATPSRMDQRQRPSRTMCSTASSIQGMATKPSVMSTWLTWLSTGPGEGEGGRAEEAGDGRQRQRPQEDVHPDRDGREQDDLGGDPGGAVGQDHEQPHQRIEGSGVEVGHQRRAAEDVLVPEGQLPVAQHGTHQHVEREVLLEVVPGDEQMATDQVRQHEGDRGDGDEHDVGPQGSDVCSKSVHWRRRCLPGYVCGLSPARAARSAH